MSADNPGGESGLSPTVGRYRILARLEQDSIGEILKGFDPLLERPVVVKVFHVSLADAAAKQAMGALFYNEMQRTGMLVHPGIVPLFDAGECPAGLFMAHEFVDGSSLSELLVKDAQRDLERAMVIVSQIVDALEYAHGQGVFHLNLKPTNVMVAADSVVKVSGFGVAAVIDAIVATGHAMVRKPCRWIAPERTAGLPGDERSDVYSLASLILDLIVGPGLEGDQALTPPMPPAVEARGVTHARWASAFDRAFHPDSAQRYASVRMLFQDLLLVLGMDLPEVRPAWDVLGFVGSVADSDTFASVTALTTNDGHDGTRTIDIGDAATPRGFVDETRAADAASLRGGGNDSKS
jgi:serine/threonine-protein kinase